MQFRRSGASTADNEDPTEAGEAQTEEVVPATAPAPPRFTGTVDTWAPELVGWVYETERPERTISLAVIVDGVVLAEIESDVERSDVTDAGFASGSCGFELDLGGHFADCDPHQIVLVDAHSGLEVFRSERAVYFHTVASTMRSRDVGMSSIRRVDGDLAALRDAVSSAGRVAVLSTHRPPGVSPRATHELVDGVLRGGFPVLVVDTSTEPMDVSDPRSVVAHRSNVGLDFASWHAALELCRAHSIAFDELLVTNDSCYGPIGPLDAVVRRMEDTNADVVSLTDASFGRYHLQSNFLLFRRSAVAGGEPVEFFTGYRFPALKEEVVRQGEIGLTRHLLGRGFTVDAALRSSEMCQVFVATFEERMAKAMGEGRTASIAARVPEYVPPRCKWLIDVFEAIEAGAPINPTHSLWDILIDRGYPFVKRDLLARNPTEVGNLSDLPAILGRHERADLLATIRLDLIGRGESAVRALV